MTVRLLVVDDEPDVEPLFRQQFRQEVLEEQYLLDFAPRVRRRWTSSMAASASISYC